MSAQEILAELPTLTAAELKEVAERCALLEAVTPSMKSVKPVLGLHRGAFIVADDFDEPLPDSFWLGKDA